MQPQVSHIKSDAERQMHLCFWNPRHYIDTLSQSRMHVRLRQSVRFGEWKYQRGAGGERGKFRLSVVQEHLYRVPLRKLPWARERTPA